MRPAELLAKLDAATRGKPLGVMNPTKAYVVAWEDEHRHDSRLSCVKAEACGQVCGVMEQARDRILDALLLLLDLWRAAWEEHTIGGVPSHPEGLCDTCDALRALDAMDVEYNVTSTNEV